MLLGLRLITLGKLRAWPTLLDLFITLKFSFLRFFLVLFLNFSFLCFIPYSLFWHPVFPLEVLILLSSPINSNSDLAELFGELPETRITKYYAFMFIIFLLFHIMTEPAKSFTSFTFSFTEFSANR